MTHRSDSLEQHIAERHVLDALATQLGATFLPGASLPIETPIKPDGVDPDGKIVVEVFARVGRLKPAQAHKVRADLFKLAYLRKLLGPQWRVIFCFADREAAAFLLGKSWAADAAKSFGVEVVVQELPEDVRLQVLAAQTRQRMINAE